MKKYFVMVLAVIFMVLVAHSALAFKVEIEREDIKKILVNRAELQVELIECQLSIIDLGLANLKSLLSLSPSLSNISEKNDDTFFGKIEAILEKIGFNSERRVREKEEKEKEEKDAIFKQEVEKKIQVACKLRESKLEELKKAKKHLEEVSIPLK